MNRDQFSSSLRHPSKTWGDATAPYGESFFFDFYHHNLSQKLFLICLLIYLLREFLAKFGFIVLRFDVISNITFNHLAWVWYIFSEELIVQGKVGWLWKSFKNRLSKVYIWFERAPLSAILTSIYQRLG